MEAKGYRFIPALNMETLETNTDAMSIGDSRYPTFVSADGKVMIGFDQVQLYLHNGNVWRADSFSVKADHYNIDGIAVDPASRGSGRATAAMKDIMAAADDLGLTLHLEPVPMNNYIKRGQPRLNQTQLVAWYKRLGFVPQSPDNNRLLVRVPNKGE